MVLVTAKCECLVEELIEIPITNILMTLMISETIVSKYISVTLSLNHSKVSYLTLI